jgi:hypothetical protein
MSVFQPGQRVAASGIYHAVHYKHRESDRHVTLLAGDIFPHCNQCDDLIEYILVRGASGKKEDRDLSGND